MLIHLEKLGKSFGEKIVLHDVTASVEREDRIGIVGQNGAGKTTLIKKLLTGSVAKEKIILLENEYGEVGVDGSFMKDSGIIVDELNSGCICCTLKTDLIEQIGEIMRMERFDYIVIEASGICEPEPIAQHCCRPSFSRDALPGRQCRN